MSKQLPTFAPETVVFLLLPLVLAAVWGEVLPQRAYADFAAARGLLLPDGSLFSAPLWTGAQALVDAAGLPLPTIMTYLSSLGWGMTALLLRRLLHREGAPISGLLLPLLLLTSPLLPAALATAVSWQSAVSLWALDATIHHRWRQQTVALLLLPALLCNWHSLLLAFILIVWRGRVRGRLSEWVIAATAVAFLLGSASNLLFWGRFFAWPATDVVGWQQALLQLSAESDFYGLALLLAGFGLLLVLVERKPLPLALLLWGEVTIFADPLLGAALLLLAALFGLHVALDRLQAVLRPRIQGAGPAAFLLATSLLISLPLFLGHGSSLWQRYRARPLAYSDLLAEAAAWLQVEATPEAAVFGPPQAAHDAPLFVRQWSGTTSPDSPSLLAGLLNVPPDFVVSTNTLPWDRLTHTGWFLERYRKEQQFADPETPLSPVAIWSYRADRFDQGPVRSIQVQAANGLNLVGYRYWPQTIQPGDAVYVTLDWQTSRPLTRNVNTIVRLIAPMDQTGWAQRSLQTPRSLPPAWIPPGLTFPESFVLTTTQEIPVGAYQLNLSLLTGREEDFTTLYQNEDTNPLDRVLLGYVTVPWQEKMPPTAVSVQATFGEQIRLHSYALDGAAQPGEALSITLYWEALQPPDADYTVFVHLVDGAGQYVTGHDAPPRGGTYPTRGWQAGFPVPDAHPIQLPADLAPGPYQLQVGLYLPVTGTRLPAVNAAGVLQPNQSLLLQTVPVGP